MTEIEVKKLEKAEDFYHKLREKINRWAREGQLSQKTGRWTDPFTQYLMVLPDLVHLMIKLLLDRKTAPLIRSYIIIGLLYLMCPIDIVPDFIPVAGFIDDLLILCFILNKILNNANETTRAKIEEFWAGEDSVFVKVKEIVAVVNELAVKIPKSFFNFLDRNRIQ